MKSSIPRGRIAWHDLLTSDPAGAIGFYSRTMGWKPEAQGKGGTPYTVWKTGNGPVGGVRSLPRGLAPHWLTYICSVDADATCAEAVSLGGQVRVEPAEIPHVGRYAVIQDPQGAIFATFTPLADAMGHDGPPQLGEFSWHELATHECAAALRFYRALFGWESTGQFDMGSAGIYFMFGRRGTALGGLYQTSGTPHWLPYARVEDVRIAAERTALSGGTVVQPPTQVPGGDWVSVGLDPQGGAFAVHAIREG